MVKLRGYVSLATQNPYPIIVYYWSILWPKIDPILVAFEYYSMFQVCLVASYKPNLSHFWANDFLTLKVSKTCDPILVTLLKMRPHYSQSSRENATPSSSTS